jgi:hypothetical protein
LILPGQAQKHITHNEALAALDILLQLVVLDRRLTAPPAQTPAEGARYIVATGATGLWVGKDLTLASFVGGNWTFTSARAGWMAYCLAERTLLVFSGTDWQAAVAAPAPSTSASQFGVNTTADSANRFAVKADAVLFANDDVTPGTGDMRLKLNRAAPGNASSLVLQTGWSGRVEFGQIGDDRVRLKVSANGNTWSEAFTIEPSNGAIGFGTSWPQARVDLVRNAGPLPAPVTGALLRLLAADSVETRLALDAYGAPATTNYRRANGTARTPDALGNGDWIGGGAAWGYGATGFSTAPRAGLRFVTTERWTDAAQGVSIALFTTATGSLNTVERLRLTAGGNLGVGTVSPGDRVSIADENAAPFRITEANATDGAMVRLARSRGTLAAPTAVAAGDRLGGINVYGHDGAQFTPIKAEVSVFAEEAFTSTAQGASLRFSTTPLGATTALERLRLAPDGSLVHRGNAQTIVDANSHLRLRPYALSALPPASPAGQLIYVSNGPNGKGLAVSNGTAWRWADGSLVVAA